MHGTVDLLPARQLDDRPPIVIQQVDDRADDEGHDRQLMRTDAKIKPHALECMEFAKAISEGGPSPVPAEQSLQVMTILDAIYESQATQREVVL